MDLWWSPTDDTHNWSDSVWATSEGGTGNHVPPTSGDNAYFSSTNNHTCTQTGTVGYCLNLSFNCGTGKFTGTFTGTLAINIY